MTKTGGVMGGLQAKGANLSVCSLTFYLYGLAHPPSPHPIQRSGRLGDRYGWISTRIATSLCRLKLDLDRPKLTRLSR
jgi:hypothetical protein